MECIIKSWLIDDNVYGLELLGMVNGLYIYYNINNFSKMMI